MCKIVVSIIMSVCLVNVHSDIMNTRQSIKGHRESSTNINEEINPNIQKKVIINAVEKLSLILSANEWQRRNVKNVVQSPISISSLLSLVLLGTRGVSFTELKRALQFPDNVSDTVIHETFQKVLGDIVQKNNGINVTMNSRIFVQDGISIHGPYTQIAQALYDSQVIRLDFNNKPLQAKDEINNWVERSTFGNIKDLITRPLLPSTRYIAVNTIYFSGGWEFPFSKPNNGQFNTGKKNIIIPMMSNIMTVPFLKGDVTGFDMISLPYKGGKYAMIIMTPTGKPGINSIQRLEYSLSAEYINELIGRMKKTKVSVTIPRMKLKHKIFLKSDLEELGAHNIFNKKTANFGRLTSSSDIYIEDIVHEAILEVTENGTVASAATAISFDRAGGNAYFQLNKPSLLFIKDLTNGLTLFFARVMEPEPIF